MSDTDADLTALIADVRAKAEVIRYCGHTIEPVDGMQGPCDRLVESWRWYQDVEHEDTIERVCALHENAGGLLVVRLVDAVERLTRERDDARAENERLRGRALGDDQCCPDVCNGGACETCVGCSAGWCVNGHDFTEGDWDAMGAEDRERWVEAAREHNIGFDRALRAAEAEVADLRTRVAPWDDACDAVGIPRGDVDGFVRHHRGNAALTATVEADTEARRRLADAEATIQRVRDVHMTCREHPHCSDSDDFCHECGQDSPCLTIRALDGGPDAEEG